jgi:PAS domain S-box-containing protein
MHLKILDNLKNNFNRFGDKIMYKEPDIIEILRDEERLGKLHSKSNSNYIDENIKETSYEDTNNKDTPNKYIDATNLNELYKTVFENSAVAITITDEKERIISWNKYTETLLGMNKEDLLLKNVSFLYPSEEWKKIRLENVRQKGMRYHLETKMIKKNNELINVEISLSVLKNHMGKTMGSIGIIKDATERKQMEKFLKESEEKFKQLYEKAPVAYHTLSPTGEITNVNDEWCKILGYVKQEVIGRSIFDFVIEDERKTALSSFKEKIQSCYK